MRLSVQLGQPVPWDSYLALAQPSCTKHLMPVSQPSCYKPGPLHSGHNLMKHTALSFPWHLEPAWEKFLLADWHWLGRPCSQNWWPSTLFAYSSTRGAGLSVPGSPGQKCFPHPSKETLCVFPCTQPWQPSFPMAHHHKTSCSLRKIHRELFHMIFGFTRIWAWGSQNTPLKISGLTS